LVRILVVDDNPAVRHYLRAVLEQQNTWQVCDEARTGAEAIQRVKKSPPDCWLRSTCLRILPTRRDVPAFAGLAPSPMLDPSWKRWTRCYMPELIFRRLRAKTKIP
jgi:hypothetical protein